jgi:hypothetical protein
MVGGARPGAGRKPGSLNKKTAERKAAVERALAGTTPLDVMMSAMRRAAKEGDLSLALEAAKAAAPYVHPRLAAIEHSGGLSVTHEAALAALDGTDHEDDAEGVGA